MLVELPAFTKIICWLYLFHCTTVDGLKLIYYFINTQNTLSTVYLYVHSWHQLWHNCVHSWHSCVSTHTTVYNCVQLCTQLCASETYTVASRIQLYTAGRSCVTTVWQVFSLKHSWIQLFSCEIQLCRNCKLAAGFKKNIVRFLLINKQKKCKLFLELKKTQNKHGVIFVQRILSSHNFGIFCKKEYDHKMKLKTTDNAITE